jgi:nucleotide-binding universal stress UspA family protein
VPTDGSDHALAAARHAFDLAETCGGTVHALFVIETDTSLLSVSKADVHASLREVREDASRQALAAVEDLAGEFDAPLVTAVREGVSDEEILAYAADTDLVVMGTHGREGVRRRLFGSVAERVVRGATIPVMTVTAGPDGTQR